MEPELRPIIRELLHFVQERHGYDTAASKTYHVVWRLHRDGWYTMRVCSVTQYAPGCVRFRNDCQVDVPKRVWSLDPVAYDKPGKMEVTIHVSEVKELLPTLVDIAEDTKKGYSSPLFANGVISPTYDWSIKAKAHYEAQRAHTSRARY